MELDPIITDYSNSKEIQWKNNYLNLELILVRTVQTVGAYIEFELNRKDLMKCRGKLMICLLIIL